MLADVLRRLIGDTGMDPAISVETLYNYGEGADLWEEGYRVGSHGKIDFNEDHINVYGSSSFAYHIAVVVKDIIDATNVIAVVADLEFSRSSGDGVLRGAMSTGKNVALHTNNLITSTNAIQRRWQLLDNQSHMVASRYLTFGVQDQHSSFNALPNLKLYRIALIRKTAP